MRAWGGGGGDVVTALITVAIFINRLNFHDIIRWIVESMIREVKQRQRERAIHLVCITDDGITVHGIFDDLLLVQLKLEIVVRGDFKISASNHTCIEGLASKVRPQVIRDLHTKTHKQFCPFAIAGDVSGT